MVERKSPSIRAVAGVLVSIGLSWLPCVRAEAADAPRIAWRDNLGAAQKEARALNRPLWIQFTGPWCQFCEMMEREAFVHPPVVEHARESFVPVKLQSDVHEDLAHRLGVTGLPSSIIVTPSGVSIARHEGYIDSNSFLAFLNSSLARSGMSAPRRPAAPGSRPAVASAAKPTPRREPEVALAGYCPVSLIKGQKLVPGQDSVTLEHAGRLYRFADRNGLEVFRKQPERFTPVNREGCPVAQVDLGEFRRGDPRFGILYGGHLYLCGDEAGRSAFLKNPERYARVNVVERGFCPHCWGSEALIVRGIFPATWPGPGGPSVLPGLDPLQASRDFGTKTRR